MSIRTLDFNDKVRRIPQKALSASILSNTDIIMIKLDITDAKYSGVAAYPYKYLPVMWCPDEKVVGGLEGIVMPKGTIVSLLTINTAVASGMVTPTSSGTIPWFEDQIDGGWVTAPIDASFFGYEDSIVSLLVPANGGAQSEFPYSTLDDDLEGWTASTDANLTLGANIPMGIVAENIYQDIRGKYLNYQTHDAYSTIVGGRLNVPFVDVNIITNFGTSADVAAEATSGYTSVWRKWAFLSFNGSSSGAKSGSLLCSDLNGKFAIQSAAVTGAVTVQTVGKLIALDTRFPKGIDATIQNYPGTRLLGTNTAGVPSDLYMFVYTVLGALSLARTADNILHYIQQGAFGYARIQIGL